MAAVETTTVNGKIILPNGQAATSGTIVAVLSSAGTAPDGATQQRVFGRYSGTIAGDGSVTGLPLVPNDVITPAGTYYTVTISVRTPIQSTSTEQWSITTSPDPINIGAVTRLESLPSLSFAIDNLSDVLVPTPSDGEALVYDSSTGQWRNEVVSGGGGSSNLEGLSDVDLGTPATGEIMIFDGSQWVDQALSGDGTVTSSGVLEVTQCDALETNPSDCGANTWATTIAANGNLTCSAISGGAGISDGTIAAADLAVTMAYSGAWDFSGQLEVPNSTTPPSGDCDAAGEAGRLYMDTDALGPMRVLACHGTAGWGPPGPAPSRVVTACDRPGCDASIICNATCGTPDNSTCVAGSAVELARAMSPSITSPVTIKADGKFDECAALNNITDVTFWLTPGSVLRKTVTASSTVNGGLLRVGDDATAHGATRITLQIDGTVQNDAISSPEAAIQIGREACAASAATWGDVSIVGSGKVIGHHDAIQWCGDRVGTNGATDLPRLFIDLAESIGGRDNIVKKGNSVDRVRVGKIHTMTNYCESADETFLGAISGTVNAGAGSPSILRIETADDPNIDNFYVGRKITVPLNAACGPSASADYQGWITAYDESGQTVTLAPSAGASFNDADCTYTIAGVPQFDEAPCRDIDWTIIAGLSSSAYWKITGVHVGVNGSTTAPDLDSLIIDDATIVVDVNDYGPGPNACTGQGHVSGYVHYAGTASAQNVTLNNPNITVNVPIDLRDDITCAEPIFGVGLVGAATVEGSLLVNNPSITINNSGDADENVRGIVSISTGAGAVVARNPYIDINNTVGSYAGTSTQYHQANTSTLTMGGASTPDASVSTSGTVGMLASLSGSDLPLAGGTMTGTITGFSTVANGDVLTIPTCANDASCRPGSIRFESKGPYDNAPWFIRNTNSDVADAGGSDHVLRFDYNLIAKDDHGAERVTTASHTVSIGMESRFPFGSDPNTVRGLFEYNIDIDPNIGTSSVSPKRPFAFHYNMDARSLSTFQLGDPTDPNSAFYIFGNAINFWMFDNIMQVADRTIVGSSSTSDPNTQGRIVIDPGANANYSTDRAVILQNAGGELKLHAGMNTSGVVQKIKFGSDRAATSGNAFLFGTEASTVGYFAINNGQAANFALAVRGHASQSAELISVQRSNGDRNFELTNNGQVKIGSAAGGSVELFETDTDPACSSGNYNFYSDLSETKMKVCVNGTKGDVPASLSGSATIDFSDPAADACSTDATITVTGAADGDVVSLGVPNAAIVARGQYTAWVSATNTVTVRHCCIGADCADPASGTFKARVDKP